MKSLRSLLYPAAVAILLSASAAARADLVHWSYSWAHTGSITAGSSSISFTDEALAHAVGSSDIISENLKVVSGADPTTPNHLSGGYWLALTITDDVTHATGTVVFTGTLDGLVSSSSASVTNTFTGLTTVPTPPISGITYQVTIGPYTPPGPPSSSNFGGIAAHVDVRGEHITSTPEPSTMMMAGLGLSLLGLLSWKRRCKPLLAGTA
jgi:hypothetical protein